MLRYVVVFTLVAVAPAAGAQEVTFTSRLDQMADIEGLTRTFAARDKGDLRIVTPPPLAGEEDAKK